MSESESVIDPFRENQRLHPMTLVQRLIVSLPGLLVLILTVRSTRDAQVWLYVIALVLYGFIAIPAMILQYARFRYRIGARELHIESGVLTRRRRSIPIDRIQNIEIQRSLLARLSGTAKVRVETAGSAGAEGVLELISLDKAYQLRDAIRAYQQAIRSDEVPTEIPGTGEPVSPAQGEYTRAEKTATELYEMSLGRVLLSGVFRFSLIYIVVMFSGLEYLNIDPVDVFEWIERGPLHPAAEFAAESPLIAIFASLVVAVFIAWITGILVNLNRFFRFQLRQEDEKLHSRQGLMTLHEGTIPLKRVQVYILRTNPLMRRFRWWAVDVQTLGLEASRKGRSTIVPFAQEDEVDAILRRLEGVAIPEAFERVSPLTIRRRFFRYGGLLLTVVAVVSPFWTSAGWTLLLLPLLLLLSFLQYRHHGYAGTEDYLFVRTGVLRHQVWVIPVRKYQAFYASQSFFQRRLGLGTLYVDTAGSAGFVLPRVVDLPRDELRARFDELVGRFRRTRNSTEARALKGG